MSAQFLFGEDEYTVYFNLESSTGGFDELGLRLGEFPLQLSRQTGGSWLVVSDDAVFDGDQHRDFFSFGRCRGSSRIVARSPEPAKGGRRRR